MNVQTFHANPAELAKTIRVTDAAAAHLRTELAKRGKKGVRLSLKEAGCTGFKYVIDEVEAGGAADLQVEPAPGVTVFIDPLHISAFKDLEIDYIVTGLNRQLVMHNPNVKDECGCGESFSV